jgi:hypothetical protein
MRYFIFFSLLSICVTYMQHVNPLTPGGGRLVGLVTLPTRWAPAHGLELGNSENHCYFLTSLKGKSIIDLSFDMRINPFQKFFIRRIS